MRGTSWRWFGVKSLYRTRAFGEPTHTDRDFDPSFTLVEERVIILRARGFDDAIRRAEIEAREYARSTAYRNPYGQRVRVRYLGACDAYEMVEPPESGREVFSATEPVDMSVGDRKVIDRFLGAESRPDKRRVNIQNGAFSRRGARSG